MIRSKLIFRGYPQNHLQNFEKAFLQHGFTNIQNLSKISTKHFADDMNDLLGERNETEYDFEFKNFPDNLQHHGTCAALAEVIHVVNETQKQLKNNGLNVCASVFFTLQSNELYPENFSLQNIFPVYRGIFGNIYKKYSFNPVYMFSSHGNSEVFYEFLKEQKSVVDYQHHMAAIFDHDQNSFSTFFYDLYSQLPRVIELKVEYASIRRIVAYICHTDSGKLGAILTFQLSYPPYVHPRRKQEDPQENEKPKDSEETEMPKDSEENGEPKDSEENGEPNGSVKDETPKSVEENGKPKYFSRDRFQTWNKKYAKEADICFSSCLSLECYDVDGHQLLDCFNRLQKLTGLEIEFRDLPCNSFIKHHFYETDLLKSPDHLPEDLRKLKDNNEHYFPLLYAIDALTSRGGEICDHFFRKKPKYFESFLQLVVKSYDDDLVNEPNKAVTRTVRTLERMLDKVDILLDIPEPDVFFTQIYEQTQNDSASELTTAMVKKGYVRVRKIVVTPTRVLLFNPDIIMGNRCIRKADSDSFIRVFFRDDNDSKLFGVQKVLALRTVEKFLNELKVIGMRTFSYFASSDFQIRDHGCYLFAGNREDIAKFKHRFGRFNIDAIPKMLSHFGQCLTPTLKSGALLRREDYCEVPDHTAGLDSNGNPYVFTSGVGLMSLKYAQKIAGKLGCDFYLPTAVHFCFRGYKGVLVLDVFKQIPEYYSLQNPDTDDKRYPELLFRDSQKTFTSPRPTYQSIEILKISLPIPVTLNKPLINILDQVSEKQNFAQKVRTRLLDLSDNTIESVISTLIHNDSACSALKEYQKIFPSQLFQNFNLNEEPFFRSLLRTSALVRMNQLTDKMKIKIPANLGRVMFGVVDESGILEPGQVFIRYSNKIDSKDSFYSYERTTVTGRVMITKKSATVPGDIRMFEAVDNELFYNLVDVVVFSKNGDRPDYNKIGGNDLSGDEKFTVIWDSDLFLNYNEEPFDYAPIMSELPNNRDDPNFDLPNMMIQSFKNYVCEDTLGMVSNSHLVNSDLYGLYSNQCSIIAQKQYQADNFQKTGIKPAPLTNEFTEDGMPPEKVERFPNFMGKTGAPVYKSGRILGILYERLTEIRDVMKVGEKLNLDSIIIDPALVVPDDEGYHDEARKVYTKYSDLIQTICDTYGISSDGQLFSNHFSTLKKLITERDEDNMIIFNAQHIIEEQLTNVYEKFRLEFFEQFGGININTVLDRNLCNPAMRTTFSRICSSPSVELRKKASAFYRAAYSDKKHLSFAWIVGDILMVNQRMYHELYEKPLSSFPLENKLSQAIDKVMMDPENTNEFNEFIKYLEEESASPDNLKGRIYRYRKGTDKLLFFVRKWAEKHGISDIMIEMDALFLSITSKCFEFPRDEVSTFDLKDFKGGLGRIFLKFIQHLSCHRKFNAPKLVLDKHCVMLHYAALQTFYSIAVNRVFDALPDTPKQDKLYEDDIIVLDLPMGIEEDCEKLFKKCAEKCGCKYIAVKKKPEPRRKQKTYRFVLKVVGTFSNVWKFRRFIFPTPNMHEEDLQKRIEMIPVDLYNKIKQYGESEIEIVDEF